VRRLLGFLVLALVLLASACDGGSDGSGARSSPATHRLLVEVGKALGAEPEDPEVEHPIPPECPDAYQRVLASATYDGVRVAVDLATGPCPDADGGYFACRGVPDLPGHAVELRSCTHRRLDDGGLLVTGRHHVYQEGTYRHAEIRWPRRTCGLTVSAGADLSTEDLARAVTEIRCE
jgi:hypothetical protein